MGSHSHRRISNRGTRIAGYQAVQQLEALELTVNWGNSSWPRLVSRLQALGYLISVEMHMKRVRILVSVDVETIKGILSGRSKKSKVHRFLVLWFAVPTLAAVTFVPLGSTSEPSHAPIAVKQAIDPCSPTELSRWLRGEPESEAIRVLTTSVLGGVTVGTLECKSSRYSYTLGSEEPKRVLKLQKLDS